MLSNDQDNSVSDYIYADYAATTPMLADVSAAIYTAFQSPALNANPNSATHQYGLLSARAVEKARLQIARLINADPAAIIFTSGATESNYLAIRGIALGYQKRGNHIISVATEHKATLNPIQSLAKSGFDVDILAVDAQGQIDLADLETRLSSATILLSLSLVNNETGIMPDMQAVAALCQRHQVHLHIDAAQAFGKVPIDVQALGCASMSISGHKIYGPKGIGALYVRPSPKLRMVDIFNGGSQGLRPGTPATPLIIGLGVASAIAHQQRHENYVTLVDLRQLFIKRLIAQIPGIEVLETTQANQQWPGIVSIKLPNTQSQAVMQWLSDRLAFSASSACSSGMSSPSHVLKAMGLSNAEAAQVIRISFGLQTSKAEVMQIADWLTEAVNLFQFVQAPASI